MTLTVLFWILIALLAVAWLRLRRRIRDRTRPPGLRDEDVERILRTGRLDREEHEPLDLEEIEEEERRFWNESSWDEAEEW